MLDFSELGAPIGADFIINIALPVDTFREFTRDINILYTHGASRARCLIFPHFRICIAKSLATSPHSAVAVLCD